MLSLNIFSFLNFIVKYNYKESNIEIVNLNLLKENNNIKKSIFTLYYKYVLKKDGISIMPNPLPEIYIDKVNNK
jgi:hypothetical protein